MKYNYTYNSKRLQHSLSTTCAQWCIYYIWRRCQGWSLRNILKPFYSKKTNFLLNDHVLNLVVNNNFKINRRVIDKEFVKMQIARYVKKPAEKFKKKHALIICCCCFFMMYKLHIYQDEYGEMYDIPHNHHYAKQWRERE